ncbi:unnamed protein product [Leptosia nina]|uniref:Uncharacterized protein n=1 Tax=Leptosia nina TaxID=320188 RepID=A0AAV1JBB5_9NEOP
MKRGIKPSHLWHWTSRKWFESVLNDRFSIKGIDQRDKYEMIKTNFILLTIFGGVMYSYSAFNPQKYITTLIRERSCEPIVKASEAKPPPPVTKPPEQPGPCPPKKQPEIPNCAKNGNRGCD